MVEDTHWEGIPLDYTQYAGFVYLITNNITGKKYIGRKYFYKTVKRALIESDWKTYTSSSKDVNLDIKQYGKENFEFRVLSLGIDRKEINYLEVSLQVQANVLYSRIDSGEYEYYNKNIMSKYFQPKEVGTEEYNIKCQHISDAIKALYARSDYIHPMKGRVHPNKGKKLPQTGHISTNKGKMWFTNGELNKTLRKGDSIPEGFYPGLTMHKKCINTKNQQIRFDYESNPNLCAICSKPIPFLKKINKCCSKKCLSNLRTQNSKLSFKDNPMNPLSKDRAKLVEKARQKNIENFKSGLTVKRKMFYLDKEYSLYDLNYITGVPLQTIAMWYTKKLDFNETLCRYLLKKKVKEIDIAKDQTCSDTRLPDKTRRKTRTS